MDGEEVGVLVEEDRMVGEDDAVKKSSSPMQPIWTKSLLVFQG